MRVCIARSSTRGAERSFGKACPLPRPDLLLLSLSLLTLLDLSLPVSIANMPGACSHDAFR